MLARLSFDHIVNTAAIVSISDAPPHPGTGEERCTVTMTDDSSFIMTLAADEADRLLGQIVPAQPGFSVVRAYPPTKGEIEPTFSRSPVLAFRATADRCVPITLNGEPTGTFALIYPSGACEAPEWGRYDDEREFRHAFRASVMEQSS